MAMSSSSCVDRHNNVNTFHPRGFLTPPPTWKNSRLWSEMTGSEPQQKGDLFHVYHKIPAGDSPYVRAKHVQLVDKDPSRAISLFWQAINARDRVDSALKDMAVVMKQLNRSDEAIEAIKSFRHLSPPDSQEALDNILVELYKQSGRVEEEIELLQYKLKQLEEGITFSGRKTKIARSQGKKKVLVTVQKEYSRLLGNLAWAYMQKKDFKSAEEHYRKALSFDADKNKQCNLAVCLMHMNKLTEAKFLLQTIPSENGAVDEPHVKSYECASEILAEFESRRVTKEMEQNHESGDFIRTKSFGGQWGGRFVSQRRSNDSNGTMSSPLPSSGDMSDGASTGFAYEKRADFDCRANHYEPKVPLAQPRRCGRYGDKGMAVFAKNANGNYCRKLSFGSSASSESVLSFASQTADYYSHVAPDGKVEDISVKNRAPEISRHEQQHEKSRADMADEEVEQECGRWGNNHPKINQKTSSSDEFSVSAASVDQEGFNDENVDSNMIAKARELHDLEMEMGAMELGDGYLTQLEKTTLPKNQPLTRSLCFDQNHNPNSPNVRCASPLTTIAGYLSFGNSQNRRRLQVFEDITAVPSH